ncbi:ankyrin repeat-containing domain protein, partial [Mycena galopus ATCC 62051]
MDDCFKQWKISSGKTLWCRGIPGSGKTVLASVVVDHFKEVTRSENAALAFIYLNHKEIQSQSPSNLLAALWRQLMIGKTISEASRIQWLYEEHSEKGTRPSLAEIHEVLSLEVAQWRKIYIVVDALDEYPEDERVVLLNYLTTLGPTVNLMLTSRSHITLPSLPYMIVEIRASNKDIRQFVDQRIQYHSWLSLHVKTLPELREQIITRIVGAVDGMFLLAKLHIESLATKTTIGLVRKALENLSGDLDTVYGVIMERINQQEKDSRDLAYAALTWVTHAQRVLTVVELQEALAVKAGAKTLDPDDRPEVGIILNVCAGLIIVDHASSSVRLVHYSTQNYLGGHLPEAQTDITRTLLTYLAFDDLQPWLWDQTVSRNSERDDRTEMEAMVLESQNRIQVTQSLRQNMEQNHPLIGYCGYSLVHAVGQPEVELRTMILKFLEAAPQWCLRMCYKNDSPTQWRALPWNFTAWPSCPSPLWVAAAANLLKIAEYILDHREAEDLFGHREVPNDDDNTISALCVAAFQGHIQMVQLLRGASLSWEAGCHCRALRWASEYGHAEIVQFLLESGADVNAVQTRPRWIPFYRTALEAAITEGHTKIVCLLFDNGANINVLGSTFDNALYAASRNGYTAIVRRVLEEATINSVQYDPLPFAAEASMEVLAGTYGQALTVAAPNGHTKICHLLLANGADINTVGREYRGTSLQLAAQNGHTQIVQLLLNNGADVNAAKGKYDTALYVASENGHTQIVSLLLEKGANFTVKTNRWGYTSLQAAAKNGHRKVVRLLLGHGADVDTAGEFGTALAFASRNGQTKMVRLLIEEGANVNAMGKEGSALHVASAEGHKKVVCILLDNGADIDAVGGEYGSALKAAVKHGHKKIVRFLRENGAKEEAELMENRTSSEDNSNDTSSEESEDADSEAGSEVSSSDETDSEEDSQFPSADE